MVLCFARINVVCDDQRWLYGHDMDISCGEPFWGSINGFEVNAGVSTTTGVVWTLKPSILL
jgi:hypothetical protein